MHGNIFTQRIREKKAGALASFWYTSTKVTYLVSDGLLKVEDELENPDGGHGDVHRLAPGRVDVPARNRAGEGQIFGTRKKHLASKR